MLPRRIPFNQIAFATLLGVGGGIYIYKPMFARPREPRNTPNEPNTQTTAENKGKDGSGQENIAKQATSAPNPPAAATSEAPAAK